MAKNHDSQPGIFCPDQLNLLNRVNRKTCDWHGLSVNGADAKELARRAISIFDSGLPDEAALFKTLRREPLISKHFHRASAELDRTYRRALHPNTIGAAPRINSI